MGLKMRRCESSTWMSSKSKPPCLLHEKSKTGFSGGSLYREVMGARGIRQPPGPMFSGLEQQRGLHGSAATGQHPTFVKEGRKLLFRLLFAIWENINTSECMKRKWQSVGVEIVHHFSSYGWDYLNVSVFRHETNKRPHTQRLCQIFWIRAAIYDSNVYPTLTVVTSSHAYQLTGNLRIIDQVITPVNHPFSFYSQKRYQLLLIDASAEKADVSLRNKTCTIRSFYHPPGQFPLLSALCRPPINFHHRETPFKSSSRSHAKPGGLLHGQGGLLHGQEEACCTAIFDLYLYFGTFIWRLIFPYDELYDLHWTFISVFKEAQLKVAIGNLLTVSLNCFHL